MANYTASGGVAVATPPHTSLLLTGTAAQRGWITYFRLACTGTPSSDVNTECQLRRHTAVGTSTAYTPTPVDLADPACVIIGGVNASAEPTYSAGFNMDVWMNPRAVVPWSAYDQRSELVIPATANAGFGFQWVTVGGVGTNGQSEAHFHE